MFQIFGTVFFAGFTLLNLIFKTDNASMVYGFIFCFFINANIDLLSMLLNSNILFSESIWLNIGIRSIVASFFILIAGEKSYQWFKSKLNKSNMIKA